VGSPTYQQQQQQAGLKPQHSGGGATPPLQLAGPLESLPETQVVFAQHGSATSAAAAAAAGGGGVTSGTQELRIHRVTTDGEGGSGAVGQGARNWDVYTGQAELEERLGKILERMRKMHFSEQRMKVGEMKWMDHFQGMFQPLGSSLLVSGICLMWDGRHLPGSSQWFTCGSMIAVDGTASQQFKHMMGPLTQRSLCDTPLAPVNCLKA
jgi:hypothetical protein